MEHREGFFSAVDGVELFYRHWCPKAEPRAVFAIVHGFGEHGGRYANVVGHLTARDYVVYAFDHRGHGRSPGRRGHVNDWSEYRNDVGAYLRVIGEQRPGMPVFMMGHSMGALIVLEYAMRRPEGLEAIVASAAPLEPIGVPGPLVRFFVRVISRIWPRLHLSPRFDPSMLSRDPAVVSDYTRDPLVHARPTVRWATEFLRAARWVENHAADVRIPMLMIHGEADRIASANGARRFFENVTFPDKAMVTYPETYHEPHNDLDHEGLLADLARWLEENAGRKGG